MESTKRSFKDLGVSLNPLCLKTWDELVAEARMHIKALGGDTPRPQMSEKRRQSAFQDYLDRRTGC